MTMIKAVGAEFNTFLELDAISGTSDIAISSTQSRGGTYSFRLGNWQPWIQVNQTAVGEFYAQLCVYPTAFTFAINLWTLYNGSTVIGRIVLGTDGKMLLYIGDNVTLLGTATNGLSQNAWNVVELYLKINDSGSAILRLNGIVEVNFSGDTYVTAYNTVTHHRFSNPNSSVAPLIYYDDIIINDVNGSVNNSWPNGLKIVLLKPTADGNYSEWTPSTGSDNYALVDELPPVIIDYVTSDTDGERDTYVIENCPTGMGPIAAVIPTYWGQKSGSPACSNIKRLMRSGGTDQVSSNLVVPTAYGKIQEILETSPFTSLPFTVSDIDGMEFGQQSAT